MITSLIVAAQIHCLQEIAYFEARGEGVGGMLAVMLVARNRVLSDQFPDTFCQVRDQPKQFSFIDQITNRKMRDNDSKEIAKQLATMVYYSGDEPYLNNALYYHASSIKPNWNYNLLAEVGRIGNHVFYRNK